MTVTILASNHIENNEIMDKTTFTMFVNRHRLLMHILFFISVFLFPVAAAIFAAEITVQYIYLLQGRRAVLKVKTICLFFKH